MRRPCFWFDRVFDSFVFSIRSCFRPVVTSIVRVFPLSRDSVRSSCFRSIVTSFDRLSVRSFFSFIRDFVISFDSVSCVRGFVQSSFRFDRFLVRSSFRLFVFSFDRAFRFVRLFVHSSFRSIVF